MNRNVIRLAVLTVSTFVAVAHAASPATQPADPFPAATPANVVAVTKGVFPAVVRIDAAKSADLEGQDKIERGIGSGVIFDADGRILTNFHVAGGAFELYVTLFNKERVRAKLIGDDHWTDLAVIQLDMDDVRARKIDFSFAPLGESRTLVPGQDVMAIGTPFGLARTLTLGTVSNIERTLDLNDDLDGFETGQYANWVQMDVPINPGNSGGPLVDLAGRVVGINTRGGAQNLNFAVPIDTAKRVVESILATASGAKPGHMVRADLGLTLRPLQDLESFYKGDLARGVLVDNVSRFGAAKAAGLRGQDILLSVNGQPTNVRFPEEMAPVMQRIAALPIGEAATLGVSRDGETITLTATPTGLKSVRGDRLDLADWGLVVREVTPAYAEKRQLDTAGGVAVTVVKPNAAASRAGLKAGDVIVAVDNKPVADAAALKATAATTRPAGDAVLLSVRRDRGTRNVLLTPASTTAAAN